MRVEDRCPICGSRGEVTSVGAFGYVASCSDCFDEDPESSSWSHLRGHSDTPELAIELWLEEAREFAAVDEIPKLRARYTLSTPAAKMFLDLEIQVRCEAALQSGFDLVEGWRWYPSHDHPERKSQDVTYLEFPA